MTGNDIIDLISGIAIGFDIAVVIHLVRERREDRRDQEVIQRHADALEARAAGIEERA
jgi:hypothetical protein